jgi:phosphoserine aminotransferase
VDVTTPPRPSQKPNNPNFSSGPCAKPPGWDPAWLEDAVLGRSHRSKAGRARIDEVVAKTRALLAIPDEYRVAIVPGSDTGAFELAMWSLLGARGVDVLAWESFGFGWAKDISEQLKLTDVRLLEAPYGSLPDLSQVDPSRDVVLTANGTTSGVRVPGYDWVAEDRQGLVLLDATSALFAQPVNWQKIDVATYSWQKVVGSEAAHGMLILSPRAIERLSSYQPPWPMPKLFRLTRDGSVNEGIFEGETINTPSMLCLEDYLQALRWVENIGGVAATIKRANENAHVLWDWLEGCAWAQNLAVDPATRSNTSVCIQITDPEITSLALDQQAAFCRALAQRLADEGAAFDIAFHRDAPPGLRIWTGATIEREDVLTLTLWLDWAFFSMKRDGAVGPL